MPESLSSPDTLEVLERAFTSSLDPAGTTRPFPSPEDWRDQPIYFLVLDRFANPVRPPERAWDQPFGRFQGGTFAGVQAQLDYIQDLGFGAIWLSPAQKNLPWDPFSYHGYGIHDFLGVEPRFASDIDAARADPSVAESELRTLVDAAHARGLYVILDVVINHVGNVFGYAPGAASADNSERPFKGFGGPPYEVFWRDELGVGQLDQTAIPAAPSREAAVWPRELQADAFFRRRGNMEDSHPREGDFRSLKELVTDHRDPASGRFAVRDALIRAHQYIIAKCDVDAFRIDTLKHVEPDFARVFGNAVREFALSIGKRNFFTFGEVAEANDEQLLAEFVGRDTLRTETGEAIGVDAALDFPLRAFLTPYVKASGRVPRALAAMYERRKQAQKTRITSHGEASHHFVTFLDNHDNHDFRFCPVSPTGSNTFDPQYGLGLGCLLSLQGIPCIYYGTEQGLTGMGAGTGDAGVREALWGKPNAFDRDNRFYTTLKTLLALRRREPALRYGRQYFRQVSGNGSFFAISDFPDGVLAFSRVLNDREAVVVANASTTRVETVHVVVDGALNPDGAAYTLLFSNRADSTPPGQVSRRVGDVTVVEIDGRISQGGPVASVRVQLQPMEIQIIRRSQAE